MTSATAPIELAQIWLDPHDFKYSDAKSWRGPCPVCAGKRRFVIFTDHEFPLWNGYCSDCGYTLKAWEKVRTPITATQRQTARDNEAAKAQERKEYRNKKLEEFTTHELYLELSERMQSDQIDWWEAQGIPEDIQKYLRLGWTPEKSYYDDERVLRRSAAYTIPWFGQNYDFKTMQYRLSNPANPADRYRFEKGLGGGAEFYYLTDPQESLKSKLIITEGAKKGIVTWVHLSKMREFSTVATVSAETVSVLIPLLKECDFAYYIPDPDSFNLRPRAKLTPYQIAMRKFEAGGVTNKIHTVQLPYKVDDGFLKYGLGPDDFKKILEMAL